MSTTSTATRSQSVQGIDPALLLSVDVVCDGREYTVRAFLDCHAATPPVQIPAATDADAEAVVTRLTRMLGDDVLVLRAGDKVVRRSAIASVEAQRNKLASGRGGRRIHTLNVHLNAQATTPRVHAGFETSTELDAVLADYSRDTVMLFTH